MSKTPYEVRLETLQLAFDILREQEYRKDPNSTEAPSSRNIVELADSLREFVCDAPVARVIERLESSPERRVFVVDVPGVSDDEIKAAISDVVERYKNTAAMEHVEGGPITPVEPLQNDYPDDAARLRAEFLASINPAGDCCGANEVCDCRTPPEENSGC